MPWKAALFFPLSVCAAPSLSYIAGADFSALVEPKFAVDRQGSLIVGGYARNCTLPAVRSLSSCGPVWIAKLDASAQSIAFATYLGTDRPSIAPALVAAIAVDREGNVVVAATASQNSLPAVNPLQSALRGPANIYV